MKTKKATAIAYPMKFSTTLLLKLIREEREAHPKRKYTSALRGKWTFDEAFQKLNELIKRGVDYV